MKTLFKSLFLALAIVSAASCCQTAVKPSIPVDKEIEKKANDSLIKMLPEEFRDDYRSIIEVDPESYEYMLVKAADKIAAYIKCVEETRIGNKEFAKAKQTLKREIDSYRKHEEVEWFCVTYLESFSLTLDELE